MQTHALQDRECLLSSNLDNETITILIDTNSPFSLLGEQLYYLLSSIPPLEPILFSVSGEDNKPLIVLGETFISITINDDTFWLQLVVTRNILFPVVLGVYFL